MLIFLFNFRFAQDYYCCFQSAYNLDQCLSQSEVTTLEGEDYTIKVWKFKFCPIYLYCIFFRLSHRLSILMVEIYLSAGPSTIRLSGLLRIGLENSDMQRLMIRLIPNLKLVIRNHTLSLSARRLESLLIQGKRIIHAIYCN